MNRTLDTTGHGLGYYQCFCEKYGITMLKELKNPIDKDFCYEYVF